MMTGSFSGWYGFVGYGKGARILRKGAIDCEVNIHSNIAGGHLCGPLPITMEI